jgi:hypothetical protein
MLAILKSVYGISKRETCDLQPYFLQTFSDSICSIVTGKLNEEGEK